MAKGEQKDMYIVFDIETMEIIVFKSKLAISRHTGISKNTLKKLKNRGVFKHYIIVTSKYSF